MSDELRVMSYNVRSLRDDVAAVAAVVRSCRPDVVLVQEAPRFLRWRSKRAALARRCGLVVATADRTGGLCILVALRVDVGETTFTALPKHPRRHRRAVVSAAVTVAGRRWTVAATHLSTDAAERSEHLAELRAALDRMTGAPVVVGADLNEGPNGAVFRELAARYQDCFAAAGTGEGSTSPAVAPRRRIDAIFADRSVTVVSCEAVDDPQARTASDHRPVLAVLRAG